jgi:nicotinamidase-related amidase
MSSFPPVLSRANAAVVVIDMQERMLAAIPEDARARVLKHTSTLLQSARTLGVPVLATEQYSKGLGHTVAEIAAGLTSAPVEKVSFSCSRTPAFRDALAHTGRRSAILAGVETHVCVLQTALDLTRDGYHVFVPADAVASRRPLDWTTALALLERSGIVVGTTELFLFQLLEVADTDEFRAISKLIK